mgnify:CR=1 FL=1
MKVAVLDDYQGVANDMADWSQLPSGTQVEFFNDHLDCEGELVERLKDFDVVPSPVLAGQTPTLGSVRSSGSNEARIGVRDPVWRRHFSTKQSRTAANSCEHITAANT